MVDQSSWGSKQLRDQIGFRDSHTHVSSRSKLRSRAVRTARIIRERPRFGRVWLISRPRASARLHNKPQTVWSFALVPTRFGSPGSRPDRAWALEAWLAESALGFH